MGLPKGKWVDELPNIVWAHNTIVSRSTNFTLFQVVVWGRSDDTRRYKFEGPRTNVQIIEEEE